MSRKSISGSAELAKLIKERRNELNLTIEEAASKAGVGTKTWCRYEAGESIRQDKYRGVCRALQWQKFPLEEKLDDEPDYDIEEDRKRDIWPKDIEGKFGTLAALSFVVGSDILLDHLNEDINEIAKLPKDSHIGQLSVSWLLDFLPPQFLTWYDYEFLYALRCNVIRLRRAAKSGFEIIAHSILDELTLMLITDFAEPFFELFDLQTVSDEDDPEEWNEWIYDLFGDSDTEYFLYSDDWFLEEDHPFHFDYWMEQKFWMEEQEE